MGCGWEKMCAGAAEGDLDGSFGFVIPTDMAERPHLAAGDLIWAVETDRGILLTPYDAEVDPGIAVAAYAAGTSRTALRGLAR